MALAVALVTTSCGGDDLIGVDVPMFSACGGQSENVVFYDSATTYPSAEEAVAAAQRAQGLDHLSFDELSERVWVADDPSDLEARIELTPPADGDGWFISSIRTCR